MGFHRYFKTFLESGFVSRNKGLILTILFGGSIGATNLAQYIYWDHTKAQEQAATPSKPQAVHRKVDKIINACAARCRDYINQHEKSERYHP